MSSVSVDGRAAEALRRCLRGLRTATLADFAETVTGELCARAGFAKAMFSWVNGPSWLPCTVSIAPGLGEDFPDLVAAVDGSVVRLADAPREAELVRRRRSYSLGYREYHLHGYRPLLDLSRPVAYAAAPMVAGNRVIGTIHTDRHTDGVSDNDIELLSVYAQLCGLVYTRLIHEDRLETQRTALQAAVSVVLDTEVNTWPPAAVSPAASPDIHPRSHRVAGIAVPDAIESPAVNPLHRLTSRELDVLRCMAAGASNAAIAQQLFISDGTVKSHVQHIYRKLGVSSRAQAAARYRTFRLHVVDSV
jgi:DNA-binding CsgD family transcriptional regulator